MAQRVLVCVLIVFASVYCRPIAFEGGNERSTKHCNCDAIDYWMPRRSEEASQYISYEKASSSIASEKLPSKNTEVVLRVWLPEGCEPPPLDRAIVPRHSDLQQRQSATDRYFQVSFLDHQSQCAFATIKCKTTTVCAGVRRSEIGGDRSTQRKLLMVESGNSYESSNHFSYGIVLSIVVFFSLVVLIALCGKKEKKVTQNEVYYSGGNVEIVSSAKVETSQRQEESGQEANISAGKTGSFATKRSNGDSVRLSQGAPEVKLVATDGTGCPPQTKVGVSTTDGAILGKLKQGEQDEKICEEENKKQMKNNEKEKERGGSESEHGTEENRKGRDGKKEMKTNENERGKDERHKERNKDFRSKRSLTAPSETTEVKGFPKVRLSLKGHSSTAMGKDDRKSTKKEKKSKKRGEDKSPSLDKPSPFVADRRSFVNRELPARPSPQNEYSDPFDGINSTIVRGDDNGDENYEEPVSRSDIDSSLYDSVDDTNPVKDKNARDFFKASSADTYEMVAYETVDTKRSFSEPKPGRYAVNQELYESVMGVYDEPFVTKPRSASDIVLRPSQAKTSHEWKGSSLEGQGKQAAPTPPSFESLKLTASPHDVVESDIEPYTITMKKGDLIVQENSSSALAKLPSTRQGPSLTPEEVEKLYTKVDKEKQKRDRMEAGVQINVEGGQEILKDVGGTSSSADVCEEEHEYETMPRKKVPQQDIEDLPLYEEVVVKKSFV